jgi:GNAT superfamily N-acetyltransferase
LLRCTILAFNLLQCSIIFSPRRFRPLGKKEIHTMTHALSSPASLVVRRLWPSEAALFRGHFDRLDAHSRAMRFGGAVHDTLLDAYVHQALAGNGLVYGAFVNGALRGVGEIRFITEHYPWQAEAAFSVEPDWQHQGLGDALLERIIAVARNRTVAGLDLWCRASNSRMRKLAEKHGAELEFSGDETHGRFTMPWPTPVSLIEEVFGEAIGLSRWLAAPAIARTALASARQAQESNAA